MNDKVKIERYDGVIIPGFINAHCHLELSHMKGVVPKGTGLPNFLSQVMTSRSASMKKMDDAMAKADKEMYENGIVAVGDHANTDNSSTLKEESQILYHTFVEVIGVEPEEADFKLKEAKSLTQEFRNGHVSITPHAPYSCSKALFKNSKKLSLRRTSLVFIIRRVMKRINCLDTRQVSSWTSIRVSGKMQILLKRRPGIRSSLIYLICLIRISCC
ncbi:amidohydrolase family protein [Sphingobacterium sp. E70]|uniref:amidohydrolase family protein n=1 Tax=Sphingobacterium sp. E70 TaxID=2853439 RepID=UPI00211C2679|nr:amidohydrolase family protein [Sphingobacterium sp. E70]ULT27906.1 amidohydrolase family protein [Sphingobacterium sp. E70]